MQRSKKPKGPTSDPGSAFYDFSTQKENRMTKMIETLQNYKQMLRDHQNRACSKGAAEHKS
jgi:hypothetical protein